MAVTCLFVFAYTRMMNVTTYRAESWMNAVQEMQWRCKEWQGTEAGSPCGLELGQATCRLFPAVPLACCLIHSKVCHLSAFLLSPPYTVVLQATWATQGPYQVPESSALAGTCWFPGERTGVSNSRQSWGQAASPSVWCSSVQDSWPGGIWPYSAPRLMYSQTSQMAGGETSLCPQGGTGGKWLLAGFTVLINPLLSDFQTDEKGGPGAQTSCRLAVLGTGSHPSSLTVVPCI